MAPKYLHFLLPTFDILIVVHFYFPLEVTEKGLGKKEKITVKRLITGMRVRYHISPRVYSAVVICSAITTMGTNTFLGYLINLHIPLYV